MATPENYLTELFSLKDKVALITGGTGVLGKAMVLGLARAGARVGILGRRDDTAAEIAAGIEAAGGQAIPLVADVLQRESLERAKQSILEQWGRLDILVNCAGGNAPEATVSIDGTFFDLTQAGIQNVIDLNLMGTILPTHVFGEIMASQKEGCIVNISSLSVPRAITRIPAYGAAKAGIENFTRWLAIELVQKYGPKMRVNAIAPGFFVAEMNRRYFLNEDGSLTTRGQTIVDRTPVHRFGDPDELVGALIWLCSPAASFVNGTVVTIDGGFAAFSGV